MRITIKNNEASVLSTLRNMGAAISAPCGGRHVCGKCKVKLIEGRILGDTDNAGNFLACQSIPLSDITVELPDELIIKNGVEAAAAFSPVARSGVALDIGTTTLSARLIDLDTGVILDTRSELNDQRVFGADVMSRINAARNGNTAELFGLIKRQTQRILSSFRVNEIEQLTVSGNTTMLHLFTNIDPSSMGELPFTPVFLTERDIAGAALSLPVGVVKLLPSIAAFIGSDIVAGLSFLDILHGDNNALFIDIGTNGEMALFHDGKLYCCSTAAGPAFEGAEISCGIGSIPGAINKIAWSAEDSRLSFTTIGDVSPLGVCGCGLIDAIAIMLSTGVIDETGAMDTGRFTISEGISLINRDVRQFQLAKSAILSGIKILCKNAGVELSEVSVVFIAGGLGFFIDQRNAVCAGLLPRVFLNRIKVCGNLSLQGAVQYLKDPAFLMAAKAIISKSVPLDLAADPAFMDEFAQNMLFEETSGLYIAG
ncbi:MAG: ASKHA domain-containing protein [Treponema sp.]|jgi:uncharacterized 2Fe-2S/4Fe-4S cluster protein (DUF4445 family)|nr:ASKHA domain-containing protein [Treponema sp.]